MRPPLYYRMAIGVACPLYRLFLFFKKDTLPHYQREMSERFGRQYLPISHDKPVIWCHAVSLGELNTAHPLLRRLLNEGYHLWITSTTQTGFARAEVLFKDDMGKSVQHSFVPVDEMAVVGRFLLHARPVMAMFIETELWATTLEVLRQKHIPSVMVNARLTPKSFDSYAKFARLSQSMMANLSLIIAQDTQSRDNFIKLGAIADKVKQAYSLKWVSQPPKDHAPIHLNRPVWVMASTHEGEEHLALQTHQKLLTVLPQALLILVPRHPERFDEVAKLCADFGMGHHRRSQGDDIESATQVYLADSMGELLRWYQACDVAVVGGSFVDKGGHNPIEPASLAKPIIMGQYTKNCTEIVRDFQAVGAFVQCDDESLYASLLAWLSEPKEAKQAGERAYQLVKERAGADEVQLNMIKQVLDTL